MMDTLMVPWDHSNATPRVTANATHPVCSCALKATRPAWDTACAATCTGAVLDTHPDQGLVALRNLVRRALWEARDTSAIAHEGGRAHASMAYAFDHADSDPLQSALRRISPSHAPLTVSRLHLLDVRWTAHPRADGGVRWEMDWDPVAVLPLGTS
jgi:hypothetical protein